MIADDFSSLGHRSARRRVLNRASPPTRPGGQRPDQDHAGVRRPADGGHYRAGRLNRLSFRGHRFGARDRVPPSPGSRRRAARPPRSRRSTDLAPVWRAPPLRQVTCAVPPARGPARLRGFRSGFSRQPADPTEPDDGQSCPPRRSDHHSRPCCLRFKKVGADSTDRQLRAPKRHRTP
jgi:hypothetical protein